MATKTPYSPCAGRDRQARDSDPPAGAELAASIAHWLQLASEAEAQAAWDRKHGLDLSPPGCSPGDHRGRTYRRTAEALQLELRTGRPHCSTCLGDHPNHQHGHRG